MEVFRNLKTIPFLENGLRDQIPQLIDSLRWQVSVCALAVGDDAQGRSHWFLQAYSIVESRKHHRRDSLLWCFLFAPRCDPVVRTNPPLL